MKKLREKLNSRSGFSLSEVLVALLIMTMVSVLLAGGMGTIMNTYRRSVNAANAQTLLSTAVTELRNELSFASDVICDPDTNTISYRSSSGTLCTIKNGTSSSADVGTTESGSAAEQFPGLCLTVGTESGELVSSAASTELVCLISELSGVPDGPAVKMDISVYETGKTSGTPLSHVDDLVISVQTVK